LARLLCVVDPFLRSHGVSRPCRRVPAFLLVLRAASRCDLKLESLEIVANVRPWLLIESFKFNFVQSLNKLLI
jgi:hypothetical protein